MVYANTCFTISISCSQNKYNHANDIESYLSPTQTSRIEDHLISLKDYFPQSLSRYIVPRHRATWDAIAMFTTFLVISLNQLHLYGHSITMVRK